jgi:hypothetical protein
VSAIDAGWCNLPAEAPEPDAGAPSIPDGGNLELVLKSSVFRNTLPGGDGAFITMTVTQSGGAQHLYVTHGFNSFVTVLPDGGPIPPFVDAGSNVAYASSATPAVELGGADLNVAQPDFSDLKVCFLNTSSFSDPTNLPRQNLIRGNSGDALLMWTAKDTTIGGGRDQNRRVYLSAFIKSLRAQPSATTRLIGNTATSGSANGPSVQVNYGFEARARTIDFEHVITGTGNDADVLAAGLLCDSIHGTQELSPAASDAATLSGDLTTFARVAYLKSPSHQAVAAAAPLWFSTPIDLMGLVAAQPTSATDGILPAPSGITAGAVEDKLIALDGLMFERFLGVDAQGSSTVAVHEASAAGLSASPAKLDGPGAANCGAFRCDTQLPDVRNVYGPDHGVGADVYAFFLQSGHSNGQPGSRTPDTDVMVAQITNPTSLRVQEIDAFTGSINLTDGDGDGLPYRSGTRGGARSIVTTLNRGSTFITVAMMQSSRELDDANDSSGSVLQPATNVLPFLQVLQTGRPQSALDTSVLPLALQLPAFLSTGDVASPLQVHQRDVTGFEFQRGLLDGQTKRHGETAGIDPNAQPVATRISFQYLQLNDQLACTASAKERLLFVNGIDITAGATASSPPSAMLRQTSLTQSIIPFPGVSNGVGVDVRWSLPRNLGAATVATSGTTRSFLTTFVMNDNHLADSSAAGATAAPRLYVSDGASTVAVSATPGNATRLVLTPYQVATTSDSLHAMWREFTGGERMMTRAYSTTSTNSLATLGSTPTQLSSASSAMVSGGMVLTQGANARFVFQQDDHVVSVPFTGTFGTRTQLDPPNTPLGWWNIVGPGQLTSQTTPLILTSTFLSPLAVP